MIKKITYSFLFFLTFQFLLFSCCKAKSFNVYLQDITFNAAEEFGFNENPISNEDLTIKLESSLFYEDITSIIDTKALLNTANATSCPDDNILYLNDFTSINITSNVEILGVVAGESLNDKLEYFIYDESELLELNTLLDSENNVVNNDNIYFRFIEDIASATSFNLTINLTTEIGSEFMDTTDEITIE